MLAEDIAMVRKPVTVMHVDHILIWITGATVHAMMDMLEFTVVPIILTYQQVQLATIHVLEAAMVLKCMIVSAVATTHIWMHMDIVPASMDTTETTVTKPMIYPITTILMPMPTDSLLHTITITTDTLETITTMEAISVIAIQPVMAVQDLMPQTVQAVVTTPTYPKDTVDVVMATSAMTALKHTEAG